MGILIEASYLEQHTRVPVLTPMYTHVHIASTQVEKDNGVVTDLNIYVQGHTCYAHTCEQHTLAY